MSTAGSTSSRHMAAAVSSEHPIPPGTLTLHLLTYTLAMLRMPDCGTAKDSVDPAFKLGMIHGWSGQPFINLAAASYSPITHRYTDVVSSYTTAREVRPRQPDYGRIRPLCHRSPQSHSRQHDQYSAVRHS